LAEPTKLTNLQNAPCGIQEDGIPLCVDLDGTLIKTDVLWESVLRLLIRNPLYVFVLPLWVIRGKASLKWHVAQHIQLDITSLPYRKDLLLLLQKELARGRHLVLATACHSSQAQRIAAHLHLFTEVLATDKLNLRGRAKAHCLVERFGHGSFDYVGSSREDVPVWREARKAIVVGKQDPSISACLMRALRPHQWLKNVIVFVPLLTAHKLNELHLLLQAALAFSAFCLCAAAMYVLNDLVDLEADRHHPSKNCRPFAAGDLPIIIGVVAVPMLLALSGSLALLLPPRFSVVLVLYAVIASTYSWRLKRIPLLDSFCLAGLYTIRLAAGHEATHVAYSPWLLIFSMFIFLGLALLKRFQELLSLVTRKQLASGGRGYTTADTQMVALLGSTSSYLAVLVMALYVNSEQVRPLYAHPMRLLFICPLLLYWVSRIWLLAHRGKLHDDPVLFAARDATSYAVGALTVLIMWLATVP
jgi:4-hydroxybenzoate polyprenyltransferase